MSFRDATFMGIMRWAFYSKLKELYPNVSLTYGYITKNTRIENDLPKDHYIDARCISGNPLAVSDGIVYCHPSDYKLPLPSDCLASNGRADAVTGKVTDPFLSHSCNLKRSQTHMAVSGSL